MNDKARCLLRIESSAQHLSQVIAGFCALKDQNGIDLTIEKHITNTAAILIAEIDGKIVVYDTDDKLTVSQEHYNDCDYYFKRSYSKTCEEQKQFRNKLYPLGFNYRVEHPDVVDRDGRFYLHVLKSTLQGGYFNNSMESYECPAKTNKRPTIVFLTRLWDTDDPEIENEVVREETARINRFRVECVRAVREKYRGNCMTGLKEAAFAVRYLKGQRDWTLSKNYTSKFNYIKAMHRCDICVATMGLHKSTGWRMGEYIAASKAIVTEKLYHDFPGNFEKGKNYLEFADVDQLTQAIDLLIENHELRSEIMKNNQLYYRDFLRPDAMIHNTLKCIAKHA